MKKQRTIDEQTRHDIAASVVRHDAVECALHRGSILTSDRCRPKTAAEYEAARAAEPDPRDEDDDAHDYAAAAQVEAIEDARLDRIDEVIQ